VRPINQNLRTNEQIRISPIRLIGENNEQLGIMTNIDAMRIAREAGLDLVEVAPNVRPPVCRLMNYGRWKYTQKKKLKKHHDIQLKEVRLRPKTDTHDRDIKIKRAIKFLKQGHKVQFTMVFRGREQSHREIGFELFRAIIESFGDRIKVDRPPSNEGRRMIMIIAPTKGAFDDLEADDDKASDDDAPDEAEVETARQSTDDDAGDEPRAAAEG
jgi:translation initiation factor IF-3